MHLPYCSGKRQLDRAVPTMFANVTNLYVHHLPLEMRNANTFALSQALMNHLTIVSDDSAALWYRYTQMGRIARRV